MGLVFILGRFKNILQMQSGADAFSPIARDRIAVVIVEEKSALHFVRTAQLEAAIQKLKGKWPSLPGASQNVAGTLKGSLM